MPSSSDHGPQTLQYFEGSVLDALEAAARRFPRHQALFFLGSSLSFSALWEQIRLCAAGLTALGIGPGSHVTIALPNCPQAVILFYAVNWVGGVAAMLHPLSSRKEAEEFLGLTGSTAAVTLEEFAPNLLPGRPGFRLILTSASDALPFCQKTACRLAEARKKPKFPKNAALYWKDFLAAGACAAPLRAPGKSKDPAAVLCSGGTTGAPKGIVLSNGNFNALAQQIAAVNPRFRPGDKMLCVLPMFHGFGLGVCVHAMLFHGGGCVLLPRFTPKRCLRTLLRQRCAYLAGVPTLFQALWKQPLPQRRKLDFLKGVFCGGDSLSPETKARFDSFLQAHGACVSIREGYGTTETVAACCLAPEQGAPQGSVGLPLPDTLVKIVTPGTKQALPFGQVGQILISGPTVMQGYLGQPEDAMDVDESGRTWVRTGDLGLLDPEGFLHFRGRIKRMIVTCGYNVYPTQLEAVLKAHPFVKECCVIGLPDLYRGQQVTAFVEPEAGISPDGAAKQVLMEHCRKHVAKYALPRRIEFCPHLPRTPLGKIDYRALTQAQESDRQ